MSLRMTQPTHKQGFTLVEVLVTMAIFALIGIASFTVLDQMSKTKTQSEGARERLQQMQFGWLMLELDIRQAVNKPTRPQGLQVSHQYMSNDERLIESESGVLALVKSGYDNPGLQLPRAELQPVVYRIKDNVLERLTYPYVNDRSEEPVVQPIFSGVEDFSVRFYRPEQHANNNQGLNSGWQGAWSSEYDMPAALEVTVTTEAYGEIKRILLTGAKPVLASTNSNINGGGGNE